MKPVVQKMFIIKKVQFEKLRLSHAIRCGVGLKNCKCGWRELITFREVEG